MGYYSAVTFNYVQLCIREHRKGFVMRHHQSDSDTRTRTRRV